MRPQFGRILDRTVIGLLIFQLMGCGTLLYPERRGQRAGHVDIGVFLLDAIGLLFFLIPGIIAFAVDFSNGCIYLPASVSTTTINGSRTQLKKIRFDPKRTTLADIENIIKAETGYNIKFNERRVQVTRLHSQDEMKTSFAQSLPEIQANRLALVKKEKML
jgi:hypothetical protein